MTESEFIQEALHLREKIYGLRVSLDRMRKALEFLSGKLQNKNDYEAQAIYNRYWHQYSSDFRVFGNLSQNEIYQLVKKRDTARNLCLKLIRIGEKLTYAVNRIRSWDRKIRIIFEAVNLCRRVQAERQKKAAVSDAREQIEEMRREKNNMNMVFSLINGIAHGMHVPGISDFISIYTQIFKELGRFCDKIADYSLKIVEETEKTLGEKGGFMNAIRNRNSVFNLRQEELNRLKKNKD